MLLLVILALLLIALILYISRIVPVYTAFIDTHLFGVPVEQAPTTTTTTAAKATTSPVVPPVQTPAAPPAPCIAPVNCNAASKLALDHYMSFSGAPQGTAVTKAVGSSNPSTCNFAFGIPGTKTVFVELLGRKTPVQVPNPPDERRLVFARDAESFALTGVREMGGPGSGFMVENLVPGTISLGGMCAVPQGGRISEGVPVEFQTCDAYAPAQLWAFDPSTGQVQPQGDRSYCMDVVRVNKDNGAKVQIWPCNETPGQVWSYDENKGEIRSGIRPGFCLEAPGANSSKGVQLGMWDCNGVASAQRFATTIFR